MPKRVYDPELDDEDSIEIMEAFFRGELKPTKNQKKIKEALQGAARRHLAKSARINIRLSDFDLMLVKRRAVEEGLPYQTLIASIVHKYVHGSLVSAKEK